MKIVPETLVFSGGMSTKNVFRSQKRIKLYIKQMQGTDKGFIYAVSWSINVGFLGGQLFLLGLKKKTYIVIWHRVTTNILT